MRSQEGPVLEALRSAAGALTDLAEEAGPILKAEHETSALPLREAAPAPEEEPEAGAVEAPERREVKLEGESEGPKEPLVEVDKEDEADESKKASGSRDAANEEEVPKKKKRHKHKSRSGQAGEPRRRRKKSKDQKESFNEPPPGAPPGTGAADPRQGGIPAASTIRAPSLGLRPAPKPKGSVQGHFARVLPPPPPPRQPREPDHPPPARESDRGGQDWPDRRKQRSRTPPKRPRGSKGAKHRQRGIDRSAYHYQAQWRRR